MIPYGIYVLTADDGKGNVAGATVNWVTQTAFNSAARRRRRQDRQPRLRHPQSENKTFTLNMLGKEHKGLAFTFFKPAQLRGRQIERPGDPTRRANGAPILDVGAFLPRWNAR